MKGVPIFLTSMVLLLTGCASTLTPDIASTVQVAIAATLTAQPTETSVPTPTETPPRTSTRELVPTFPATPIETSPPFTHTLGTYQGRGFSFQYPAGARLEQVSPGGMAWQLVSPATDEIHVIGPQLWIKRGDADWSRRGPAYRLVIRTYENPEGLDAESWARNYILASWREAREHNRPWGSLPVSEEGEIDESKVGSAVVADQPSFWVSYFNFDSTRPAYYLATDGQIVELSFPLYLAANQPLAMVQRDVYVLILGTFRFEESETALPPGLTIETYALKGAPQVEPLAFRPVQGTAQAILQKRQAEREKRVGEPLAVELSTTLLGGERLVTTTIHTDTVEGQAGAVRVKYGGSVIYSVPLGPASPVGGLRGL